jgi:hypothetical protein
VTAEKDSVSFLDVLFDVVLEVLQEQESVSIFVIAFKRKIVLILRRHSAQRVDVVELNISDAKIMAVRALFVELLAISLCPASFQCLSTPLNLVHSDIQEKRALF